MTPRSSSQAAPSGGRAARAQRADARRNQARLLDAAEAVFAAKGTKATTEEIARRAGVGIGTVFRHFPTKEALVDAIFVDRLRRLADEATALAAAKGPAEALFSFFTSVVDQAAARLAFVDALAAAGVNVMQQTTASPVGRELLTAVGSLLRRAQRVGAVRDDIGIAELLALLVGTSRAAQHAGWDPDVQANILAVVFDGLRPFDTPDRHQQ
jgi:AcrR family transcriptional regulator